VYVRDSGIVHALLNISDHEALLGHPVAGTSWEGFVIENLIAAAPAHSLPFFYRTAAGVEIDVLLEIPGHGLWAVEVKRGLSGQAEKGFGIACWPPCRDPTCRSTTTAPLRTAFQGAYVDLVRGEHVEIAPSRGCLKPAINPRRKSRRFDGGIRWLTSTPTSTSLSRCVLPDAVEPKRYAAST
jgi:hypothetical protein